MKRRIIAALTALVMVVTMIPASAFAATTPSEDALVNNATMLIKAAFESDPTMEKVDYSKKQAVINAVDALNKITDVEKRKEVAGASEILAARNAFNNLDVAVKNVNDLMSKVKAGTVVANDLLSSSNSDLYNAILGYQKIRSEMVTGTDNTIDSASPQEVKIVLSKDADKEKAELDAMFGANNAALYGLVNDGIDSSGKAYIAIYYVNAMEKVTEEAYKNIDASNYDDISVGSDKFSGIATQVNNAKNSADYIVLAKGYDMYIKVSEKVAMYDNLKKEITKVAGTAKQGIVGDTPWTAKTLSEIDKLTATEYAKFEADLKTAKALIDENTTTLKVDFTTKEYENLKAAYKVANENNELFKTKDSVYKELQAMPEASEVPGMEYKDAAALYDKVMKIDANVAHLTTLGDKYDKVKAAVVLKMSQYSDEFLAEEYAKEFVEAMSKVNADATRADADAVNAAIEIINEYGTVSKESISLTKLDTKGLFGLVTSTGITSASIDIAPTLKAAIVKADANAFNKLAKAVADINAQATKDKEAAIAVAQIITSKAATTLNPANITTLDKANEAQKVLDKYTEEYNKLNAYAKADFDRAVAEENAIFDVTDTIKEAKDAIAQFTDGDVYTKASEAMTKIAALLALDLEDIKTNPTTKATAITLVNETEKILENDAVESLVEKTLGTVYTTDYANRKDEVLKLVPDTAAPVAVINAIAALKELDTAKVTKAELDSAITSYETAKKMYDQLTVAEKAKVTNGPKLVSIEENIKDAAKVVVASEINKIGDMSAALTENQKAVINNVGAMLKQYEVYVSKTDISNIDVYNQAVTKLENEEKDKAKAEFDKIVPALTAANAYYASSSNSFIVNKDSAKAIVDAVAAVAGLSDEARKYADDPTRGNMEAKYHYEALVKANEYAKALILDYATIEVSDVDYAGAPATPVVVVKDANGKVVADTEYTVAYSNNEKPGTATVIVTAKADGNYIGTVSKEFKVIAKELAKVENVKFDTDYGIVRVYFDRSADIDGIDVRYQVQYKKTTSDTWTTKYPTVGYEYLTLKNLTKNGQYDVRVRAYTDDYGTERVYGEYSDVKTVYANRNGSKSGIMYKAVINKLTTKNGSVTVKVNDVNYTSEPTDVTWKYSYKKYGSQYTTWSTWKSTKNTSYTFKNLKKGTRYVFRVQYTYTSAVDGKTAVNSNYSVYKNIVVK